MEKSIDFMLDAFEKDPEQFMATLGDEEKWVLMNKILHNLHLALGFAADYALLAEKWCAHDDITRTIMLEPWAKSFRDNIYSLSSQVSRFENAGSFDSCDKRAGPDIWPVACRFGGGAIYDTRRKTDE